MFYNTLYYYNDLLFLGFPRMKKLWEETLHSFHHSEFYEYSVTVEFADKATGSNKTKWNLENKKLYIYNSDKNNLLPLIESSENSENRSLIVIIKTNAFTKSLLAMQTSDTDVQFISHCALNQKKGTLCLNEFVEIFNFDKLFDTIADYDIDFDPSEAQLRFKDNFGKIVIVTIYSKTAKSLFVSMLADPFDSHFRTLKLEPRVNRGTVLFLDICEK